MREPVFDRVWFWKPRLPGEKNRKGMACALLIRGKRNSVMVQLEDGERVITSAWAIRRKAGSK
jgi:hypothetical protein